MDAGSIYRERSIREPAGRAAHTRAGQGRMNITIMSEPDLRKITGWDSSSSSIIRYGLLLVAAFPGQVTRGPGVKTGSHSAMQVRAAFAGDGWAYRRKTGSRDLTGHTHLPAFTIAGSAGPVYTPEPSHQVSSTFSAYPSFDSSVRLCAGLM